MLALLPHLAKKNHIIWDWNGTLLSDLDLALNTVNLLLREEGLSEINKSEYKLKFGFPIIDYYKSLGFDTSPEKFADLCERFNEAFHNGMANCSLWPGARELLWNVQESGKVQSLLSATEQQLLHKSVRLFDLESVFHHVMGIGDKMASSKVARGHELMQIAGVPREQTVLIGDTNHDLEVGESLGIDVILISHGHQCETRLKAVHHTVLNVL